MSNKITIPIEKLINNTSIEYGWVCPKCGRVYAPFTSMCCYCNNLDSQWTCSDSDTFLVHYHDLPTYCEDWNESGFSY